MATVTGKTATPAQIKRAVDRLYALAEESVGKSWNNPEQLLGPVLYRALLAEEMLRLAAKQTEDTKDSTIRFMVEGFWAMLVEKHPCS